MLNEIENGTKTARFGFHPAITVFACVSLIAFLLLSLVPFSWMTVFVQLVLALAIGAYIGRKMFQRAMRTVQINPAKASK